MWRYIIFFGYLSNRRKLVTYPPMKRWISILPTILVAAACESPNPSTPKGAFALLAPCVDKVDLRCIYRRLDQESIWAVQTIHKTLAKMRSIVEQTYPNSRKAEAYGSWKEEAATQNAAELFEVFCKKRKCLESITSGFGAIKQVHEIDANRAKVETIRGKQYEMAKYKGKFGLATYQEELLAAKLRFIDSLKQAKKNAKAFEEQRAASGQVE